MCTMVVPTGFGVCLGLGFPVVVVVWLCIMGFVVGLVLVLMWVWRIRVGGFLGGPISLVGFRFLGFGCLVVTLVVMWSCALVGVCLGLSFFVGWCGMTLGFASLRLVWRFGFDVGFCGGWA